ncbi:glycerophosphoryl diester phosphodiesterase membrane domain-containing protein [Sphingopyxis sp.]|uniref:glycerophosphoryl diester phosphodiesterase membrane domain-containing protein n=1 Tax=Sphingopyxis sp. TaxID=1908224 RepID=UPI002ED94697
MNRFNIGQAWSNATGFFSGNAANHAIALIGIGILIPLALQWIIVGNPMSNALNPAMMRDPSMMAGMGLGLLAVSLLSYVLQFGSYFTSWRLGLGTGGDDLAGGLRFGVLAALALVGMLIVTLIVAGVLGYAISPWLAFPFVLIVLLYFVVMYPALFGFLMIVFLLMAVFGSYALSGMAPMMGGGAAGGGIGLMIVVLIGFLMLWLAARLCCTAPSMADRQEILPFEAMKRSWAMTSEGQWRIVGYFLLIGAVLLVLAIILGLIVGSSMQSLVMGGGVPGFGTVILMTILISIPMAYFTVAIPGGIYRSLGHTDVSQVFT